LPGELRAILKQPSVASRTESTIQTNVQLGTASEVAAARGSTSRSAFVKRYLDLYRTARLLNGFGTTVKVAAFILGIIIFLFWFFIGVGSSALQQQNSPFGPSPAAQSGPIAFYICFVIGAVAGGLTTGLFFLLGVLISAQGQLLKAQADGAVHTSPFLTNEERATAMSLPYFAPANAASEASAG
jgi:hypothetical protein